MVLFRCKWYGVGIPQLVSAVPLRTYCGARTRHYLVFFHREIRFFVPFVVTTGYRENVIIIIHHHHHHHHLDLREAKT